MRKTITISGKDYEFESTALTAHAYKKLFGSDVLAALNKEKSLETDKSLLDTVQGLAFVMNMQATGMEVKKLMRLSEDDFWVWLNSFEYGDLTTDTVINEVIGVWTANLVTTAKSKNAEGAQPES